MRFNLARKNKGLVDTFVKEMVRDFCQEYEMANMTTANEYVTAGQQGLQTFVGFINRKGYNATMYYLEPNRDLFSDVGDRWAQISRTSPSFGFDIPDSDPKLVEFKLRNG